MSASRFTRRSVSAATSRSTTPRAPSRRSTFFDHVLEVEGLEESVWQHVFDCAEGSDKPS